MKVILLAFFGLIAFTHVSAQLPGGNLVISPANPIINELINIQFVSGFNTTDHITLEVYAASRWKTRISETRLNCCNGLYSLAFLPDSDAACLMFRLVRMNNDRTSTELRTALQFIPICDSSHHPLRDYYISLPRVLLNSEVALDGRNLQAIQDILEEGMERFPDYRQDAIYQNYLQTIEAMMGHQILLPF